MRKKHDPVVGSDVTAADGARLLRAQSLKNALVAGFIVVLLYCVFWIALSSLLNRVFPWITIPMGWLVGLAVRHAGRGLDWRFVVIAAVIALFGAFVVNVAAAAAVSAEQLGTTTLDVLSNITQMTWQPFFTEATSAVDILYAFVAAVLAAFFALRRLTRRQNFSLRLWKEAESLSRH